MTTLSVWKFDSPDGAADGLTTLRRLHTEQLVQLQDAAMLNWPEDATKPSITPLNSVVGAGALGGTFWGTFFALGYLVPALGLAITAGVGPLIAPVAEVGLDEHMIKELRDKVTRGTSALLLLTISAVTDAVLDEMKAHQGHAELLESNLTREQETKLRRTFAVEREPAPRRAAA
jgi:uncharacterized membrane protein